MAGKLSLGLSSDFSAIASRYDATRDIPERCPLACYDRLIERGPFSAQRLDFGCGLRHWTGVATSGGTGLSGHGIDISEEMIKLAQRKVRVGWRARYVVGDVRDIAANDGSIDAVVVSKLFQHIQDWKEACRELIRVVRAGSNIVQINERGAFGNSVRRYFSKRADQLCLHGRSGG